MKYIFRGITIFEYDPKLERRKVVQHNVNGIASFDYCSMIDEDYKMLGKFFETVYRHTQGEEVSLIDIEVN